MQQLVAQEIDQALYQEIVASVKSVDVPLETLKKYEGEYELQAGFTLTFYTERGRFMSLATGQDPHEMQAQSQTKFQPKDFPAVIEFRQDKNGKWNEAVLAQSGKEFTLKRLQ